MAVNEAAFAAWLRTIARHLMFLRVETDGSVEQAALMSVEEESETDSAGDEAIAQ
jgi:DNA-directed RNA polymerase specialized sigma24 family protein